MLEHENEIVLDRSYPSPFFAETQFSFSIELPASVQLRIYNSMGEEVRKLVDVQCEPGRYFVPWDGKNECGLALPNGIFVYRLTVDGIVRQRLCQKISMPTNIPMIKQISTKRPQAHSVHQKQA